MKLTVLGSGSEGNSVLINADDATILVDAGFSGKRLAQRMLSIGLHLDDVDALFLTHEHLDHIRGAGIISRRHNIDVFASQGTLKKGQAILGKIQNVQVINGGGHYCVGSLRISPFDISHDATEPVGYIIEHGSGRVGVCTDSGCVTHLMRDRLKACDALVLEMNHDPTMLLAGPYPWSLKQRIRSRIGHLSNDDASEFLKELWHPGLKHVFLAHLSKENNLPELVRMSAEDALNRAGCSNGDTRLHVTSQDTASEVVSL